MPETYTFQTVLDHLQKGDLLILDLDNTLVQSATHYGSYQWGNYLVRRAVEKGQSVDEALDQIMPLWDKAQKHIEITPVEKELTAWLEKVKELNISYFALTGRSHHIADITLNHLKKNQIEFPTWPHIEEYFRELPEIHFENGVLFVGHKNSKGVALDHVLSHPSVDCNRILFVDDQLHYLNQVEETATKYKIPFLGFHYKGAEKTVNEFSYEKAEAEQQLLEGRDSFF